MARRTDIDMAKGLAILLVVFGHLVARADPTGVGWYEPLRRAVYAFHMPFFFYLAGLVFVLRPGFLARRAQRLLLPFFALGILTIIAKYAAARIMFVDNPPQNFCSALSNLLWHTAASAALSIWFLFVLFVYTTAATLLRRHSQHPNLTFLLIAAILYLIPLPPYLYLDRIARYAIFFLAGLLAGQAEKTWLTLIDRVWPFCLAILLLILIPDAPYGTGWQEDPKILLAAGCISMPALHGLLRRLPLHSVQTIFLFLGRYCFMIYLFNTLFIGLAKGLLLHVWAWNNAHFCAFALALMAAGIFGPITLKRYALKHIPTLDRLTN
jgi:fucose 4-O-acetylase-like acetyltransferase